MKLLYAALFFVFTYALSAQNVNTSTYQPMEEIPGFKLYPNPVFDNEVFIKTERNALKEVTIYDVFGETVLRDNIKNTALSIADLAPGVYVLQVIEEKKTITRKLVVK